jgi:hypothetical protein
MNKRFVASVLLLLSLMATVPVTARDTHAGRPSDPGVGVAGRDTHAGRPGGPDGVAVGGARIGGGMGLAGGWMGVRIYQPVLFPPVFGASGVFLNLFTYLILGSTGLY